MLLTAAALALAAQSPMNSSNHDCAGGAVVFFEPGSDRFDRFATERLLYYADYSQQQNADSQIYIESGGGGATSAFDESLSRRRSERIRAFLLVRGIPANRIHIQVRQLYGRDATTTPDESYTLRIGHVYEMVSREEYRRLYPPNLIVECF